MKALYKVMLTLWLSLGLGASLPALAAEKDAAGLLRQYLGEIQALQTDFQQTVLDSDGYELQSMTGQMIVARPGFIRWQTEPPYEQLLVANGTTLWLYDKDLEQVTVRPFMRDIADSPAMLLIGDLVDLEDRYRVTRGVGDEQSQVFTLVPVDNGGVYQRLELRFQAQVPAGMTLWDSLGQVTQVTFSQPKLNPSVDNSRFDFDIPPGVDVLTDD